MKRNWFQRGLSFLLALVLVFELAPTLVKAYDEPNENILYQEPVVGEEIAPEAPATAVIGEDPMLREETVKHFRMEDGSYIAVDYGIPVHYSEDGEIWEDFDNTLVAETAAVDAQVASTLGSVGSTSWLTAVNGKNTASFAASLGLGFLYAGTSGEVGITLSLPGQPSLPVVQAVEDVDGNEKIPINVDEELGADTEGDTENLNTAVEDMSVKEENMPQEDVEVRDLAAETEENEIELMDTNTTETDAVAEESTETELQLDDSMVEMVEEETEAETKLPVEPLISVYNQNSVAEVSYPDHDEGKSSANGIMAFSGAKTEEREERTLMEQIQPERLRTIVTYREVYPDVDFQYELTGYNLKESIVVKARQDNYSFSFCMDLNGLVPVLQEDGSVALFDDDESVRYWIPAPYMVDEEGNYSDQVAYTLEQLEDGSWLFVVCADASWVDELDRAFPVVIDPTLIDVRNSTSYQTCVGVETGNYSYTSEIGCGYNSTFHQFDSYLKFNSLPSVPEGAVISRAQVGLALSEYHSNNGSEIILYMHELTTPINYQLTIPYNSSLRNSRVLDYVQVGASNVGQLQQWDVTLAAKHWYEEPSQNFGLVMSSNSTSATCNRAWFYRNHNVVLVVQYRDCTGVEPYMTYQTVAAGNAGTAYIGDYTGRVTMAKELVSYASSANPFSLQMVFNSANVQDYRRSDVGPLLGYDMHMGPGMQLNVMERIEKRFNLSGNLTADYLQYTDGDGTVHYFAKDPDRDDNYYYDEEGLNLKIEEYATEYYHLIDDNGNQKTFCNGILTIIEDSDGNKIQLQFSHNGVFSENYTYPYGDSSRIHRIVQKNKSGLAITVASFTYNSNGYLVGITDAANNSYTFTYPSGYIGSVSRNGTVLAQYHYNDRALQYMYDPDGHYGIAFTYDGKQVSSYYEITSASAASQPGIVVNVSRNRLGQTIYTDCGVDRTSNSDDNTTCYSFDYSGRTVNTYTVDSDGRMVGASNAVYSGIGTTDKTNNRTLRTASIGVPAMNVLPNSSLEDGNEYWTFSSGASIEQSTASRTGNHRAKLVKNSNNLNVTGAEISMVNLVSGAQYTFSAYVRTDACTAIGQEGVYLAASSGNLSSNATLYAKGVPLTYQTSTAIDDGWVRISVTFTAPSSRACTLGVYMKEATGSVYADDFQLERNDTPSNRNLLKNGDFQNWGYGWSGTTHSWFYHGIGMEPSNTVQYSMQVRSSAGSVENAYQEVPVQKAGRTYVLSGWAMASAVPDNLTRATGDYAQERDTYKAFGLRAELTYDNGTKEYHYFPFNPDLDNWQFVSGVIVPKQMNRIINTIKVYCVYERSIGDAYFDWVSLVQEVAQTMRYNSDGKLESVQSTGNSAETAQYNANGTLASIVTGGNGTITYSYDSTYTHRLSSASNGKVKDKLDYDDQGNVSKSEVTSEQGNGTSSLEKIVTRTGYDDTGNLVTSRTGAMGYSETFFYNQPQNVMSGMPSSKKNPYNTITYYAYDSYGRTRASEIGGYNGRLEYTYENGMLTQVLRNSYTATQTYRTDYDDFGNRTGLWVGDHALASYTYGANNGLLEEESLANGFTKSYSYDNLGRVSVMTCSDGTSYHYSYTGDGQLYSVEERQNDTVIQKYLYQYDTIGRLMGIVCNGTNQFRSAYQYDDNNRLTRFSYQIPGAADQAFESFYYKTSEAGGASIPSWENMAQGTLYKMSMFNNSWIWYNYDSLSRLSYRNIADKVRESYTYLPGVGTDETTTLPKTYSVSSHSGTTEYSSYTYYYNKLGNISSIYNNQGSDYIQYSYDDIGQLTRAAIIEKNPDGTVDILRDYYYNYDKAGNITSKYYRENSTTYDYLQFHYDDPDWADLLTNVSGHDFTYDASGNPLTYYNGREYQFTWAGGRQLESASVGGSTYTYAYDPNGMRTTKTTTDGSVVYFVVDGVTVAEQKYYANGTLRHTLKYLLDENKRPVGISINYPGHTNWTTYYFIRNLQGDVEKIVNTAGVVQAAYTYDPYGKIVSIKNAAGSDISPTAAHIANYNPFRYRGYYYDAETGFYYLQSRYYDPSIGRFLNADVFVSTGQGVLGYNMFAYCNNSPVCSTDENGCAQISLLDPRNITAEGGVLVPPWTLVGFILGLLGIGAIEQKPKTDTFEDSISIAEVAQEDDENDAVFWGVNFRGGTPNIITNKMNYDEAKLWAIGIAASGVYSSRASWGLVTQKQQDALAMAIDLGGGPPVYHAAKSCGYLPHYHTFSKQIGLFQAASFHVWFGEF